MRPLTTLPFHVWRRLKSFADMNIYENGGIMLVSQVDIGVIPPTPQNTEQDSPTPQKPSRIIHDVAEALGYHIGYKQEHGGLLVQDIYPKPGTTAEQISTSSKTELLLHTETAFHPYRPRFVVLLCLRGDEQAKTTFSSAKNFLAKLDKKTKQILSEPRFTTTIDISFLNGGAKDQKITTPVLSGTDDKPVLVFDTQLMRGTDDEAQQALLDMSLAIAECVQSVTLHAGDLLILDNHRVVHGRTSFVAKFDGTDRWVLRALAVEKLPPKEHISGRVITTQF